MSELFCCPLKPLLKNSSVTFVDLNGNCTAGEFSQFSCCNTAGHNLNVITGNSTAVNKIVTDLRTLDPKGHALRISGLFRALADHNYEI